MLRLLRLAAAVLVLAAPSLAQPALLYDNGPFVTSTGDGPDGADVSLLQNTTLGLATTAFGHRTPSVRVADDVVVPAGGWTLSHVVFYAYQEDSGPTPSLTAYTLRILDGPPDDPASQVVFGDTTTNRLRSTAFANVYRTSETRPTNVRNPIMRSEVAAAVTLPAGTYWLDWGADGTLDRGPWAIPITILGQTATGNAKQWVVNGWGNVLDLGDTQAPQGFPFQLYGTGAVAVEDTPAPGATLAVGPNPLAGAGTVRLALPAAADVRVTVADVRGRTVAVLHDGLLAAGPTALPVDVASLPAGVYLVRATGAGVALSQRVTVVR